MATATLLDQLIEETRALDARAAAVQGERGLLVAGDTVEELVAAYHDWYARSLTVLPPEFREKFVDLYQGGMFVKRIKHFLEGPGRVSPVFDPAQESAIFPYWEYPFETTFHSSLLEQRQLLTLAKQTVEQQISSLELELVERIGRGLPVLIDSLARRQRGRPAFQVSDEYDIQDLVGGILRMIFEDVRAEDPSPSRAGGSSRIDFVLKRQRIVVEVKMTRQGLRDREVGNQLIEDVYRYRSHPECAALVAIVFDPDHHIRNPRGLEDDLSGARDGLVVRVVVAS